MQGDLLHPTITHALAIDTTICDASDEVTDVISGKILLLVRVRLSLRLSLARWLLQAHTPYQNISILRHYVRARTQISPPTMEVPINFEDCQRPGLGGVSSLGESIAVETRGDGNCYFTATTIGALAWAATQEGTKALENVASRYADVIYDDTAGAPLRALSQQLVVRMSTSQVQNLEVGRSAESTLCLPSVDVFSSHRPCP